MRSRLATTITVATLVLAGCGSDPTPDPAPDPMAPPPEPFAINGSWLYLGPSDVPHTLAISPGSMVYTDVAGGWSSNWTIKAYDNALHHFQVAFGSGSGSYRPVGESMSGAYDVSGSLLTVQLANGLTSYPPLQGPGTCTSPTDGTPVPECRLYIQQN